MKAIDDRFDVAETNVAKYKGQIELYRTALTEIDAHVFEFEWDPIE